MKLTPPANIGYTSISPYGTGRFSATNVTLELLISLAWEVSDSHIVGAPDWLAAQHYELQAKAEDGVTLTYGLLKPRLRQLLAQRFNLMIHREARDLDG